MRISRRIKEIEKLIPKNSILADIGCDHAYLDCLAIQHHTCLKCYACDIGKGPLECAKKTIKEMNCEDYVFPILSNGLEKVPSDANVCVISGMGFETIKLILEGRDLSQFNTLILQSNCDVEDLRKWLISHGFKIVHEKMVHEGHFYSILVCEWGSDRYDEEDYLFGKFCDDQVFIDYWTFRKERISKILISLKDEKQIKEFQKLYSMIEHRLNKIPQS